MAIVITECEISAVSKAKPEREKSVEKIVKVKTIDSVLIPSTFCRWGIVRYRTQDYGPDSQQGRPLATLRLRSGLGRSHAACSRGKTSGRRSLRVTPLSVANSNAGHQTASSSDPLFSQYEMVCWLTVVRALGDGLSTKNCRSLAARASWLPQILIALWRAITLSFSISPHSTQENLLVSTRTRV